jgi:hypothetical protein
MKKAWTNKERHGRYCGSSLGPNHRRYASHSCVRISSNCAEFRAIIPQMISGAVCGLDGGSQSVYSACGFTESGLCGQRRAGLNTEGVRGKSYDAWPSGRLSELYRVRKSRPHLSCHHALHRAWVLLWLNLLSTRLEPGSTLLASLFSRSFSGS